LKVVGIVPSTPVLYDLCDYLIIEGPYGDSDYMFYDVLMLFLETAMIFSELPSFPFLYFTDTIS
jgi:hypothetical protein